MGNDLQSIVSFVRTLPGLCSLSESDLQNLLPLLREQEFEKGEHVYRQGAGTACFYFIRRGRIKVSQTAPNGKEVIVGFYGPKELIGCCGLLGNVRYPCYAQAVQQTALIRVPRQEFLEVIGRSPEAMTGLMQHLVRRLRTAHGKMKSLALEPAERRVVTVLVELGEKFGSTQGKELLLTPSLTRQQIAEMAGTTLETASRVISRLRRDGFVRCSKRNIILVRPELLQQVANDGF